MYDQKLILDLHRLLRSENFDEALEIIDSLLKTCAYSPYLLVQKAVVLMLLNRVDGPPLAEAEQCLLRAYEINPNDLSAIEELAHFYDAVESNPERANHFAKLHQLNVCKSTLGLAKILSSAPEKNPQDEVGGIGE